MFYCANLIWCLLRVPNSTMVVLLFGTLYLMQCCVFCLFLSHFFPTAVLGGGGGGMVSLRQKHAVLAETEPFMTSS